MKLQHRARPRQRLIYRVLHSWASAIAAVFYRKVAVTGDASLPTDAPVIVAANHTNALADVAVLLAKLPRFPHFLAASSWWKRRAARTLFELGGVLPVHRNRPGEDTGANEGTFDRCSVALGNDEHLVIFPEGEVHAGLALLRIKTGAARIALTAAAEHGVKGILLAPVGITYEDRGRFRSDVEVHFADAISIDEWTAAYCADPENTVREVTERLREQLTGATVNHSTEREAEVVRQAALIAGDGRLAFAALNQLRREIALGINAAGGEASALYEDLDRTVAAHAAGRVALNLDIEQSLAPCSPWRLRSDRTQLVLLAAPAALGALTYRPVLLGTAYAAQRLPKDEWHATAKGVAGSLLIPALWTAEVALLRRRFGLRGAMAMTAAGALCGLAALHYRDHRDAVDAAERVNALERDRPEDLAYLRESQRRVVKLVGELCEREVTAA